MRIDHKLVEFDRLGFASLAIPHYLHHKLGTFLLAFEVILT